MCTALSLKHKESFFGRNLDLYYSYNETVTVTPRNFELKFRNAESIKNHPAFIGMAFVCDNYPLYYDCVNEYGLAMAGLNFPGNAFYADKKDGMKNIASFEFIPWILGNCKTIEDVKDILKETNITNEKFSEELPPTPLHYIISDTERSITVESVKEGLKIYDNEVEVLTNNPAFDYHILNMANYIGLSADEPENIYLKDTSIKPFCFGMGAVGLPGDFSSPSRFVKTVFLKQNTPVEEDEEKSITSFFNILGGVSVPKGAVKAHGKNHITIYSSCINQNKGIYYYKTYNNSRINAVDMRKTDLDEEKLFIYGIDDKQDINFLN